MPSTRQLAAIMFTDIVGYTSMMQSDEKKAVTLLKRYNTTLEKWVTQYGGRVANYYGDGSLSLFNRATEAVVCAVEIQKDLRNDPVVPLRIGQVFIAGICKPGILDAFYQHESLLHNTEK